MLGVAARYLMVHETPNDAVTIVPITSLAAIRFCVIFVKHSGRKAVNSGNVP